MDIEKYKALMCAIEYGSYTAAAEKLQYTPSGISRMMLSLEELHGFPLLMRGKDGVEPTKECRQLIPQIRELIYQAEKLRQLSNKIKNIETGSLIIGTAYSRLYEWITDVNRIFHKKYPGIDIKIVSGYSSDLLNQLNEHKVDIAIISEREGKHEWIPLFKDQLMAMIPEHHPMASLTAIPVEIFKTEPYINTYPGKDIDNARVFKQCGIIPNTQFSTMDLYATYAMVSAGLGISMNNLINCRDEIKGIKKLPLYPLQYVNLGIAVTYDRTPALQSFMEFAVPFIDSLKQRAASVN